MEFSMGWLRSFLGWLGILGRGGPGRAKAALLAAPRWRYFHLREFAQHERHGYKAKPYPEKWIETRLDPLVREVLDPIRGRWGGGILVTSAYRSLGYNKAVGGAWRSQHRFGRAVDIRPLNGTALELHKMILRMVKDGELPRLKGLGKYKDFVHVDIRPGERLKRWVG